MFKLNILIIYIKNNKFKLPRVKMNLNKKSSNKNMKRLISVSLLLYAVLALITPLGCSSISSGLKGLADFIDPQKAIDEAKKTAEDKNKDEEKDKKKPQQLRIGFIPFDYSFETGQKSGDDAIQALSASMIKRESFKPYSLKLWLAEDVNKVPAVNIQQIIDRAKGTDIAIDSICYGKIFKVSDEYGLYVEVYPLIPGIEPTYYFRSFYNYSSLDKAAEEIVAEMENRSHVPRKTTFNKKIYIKSFNLNFYSFSDLQKKGEGSIIQIPYLNIDGTSYKTDDTFFSSMLLYHIHTSRLFRVWNSNIKQYIQAKPTIPNDMDVIISVDLDISRSVSMLTVRVNDIRKKNVPEFKYQYPFKSMNMQDINDSFRENVKIIVLHLLNDEEKKYFGIVNLDSIGRQKPVFCEGYFLGYGRQHNLLFPSGSANLDVAGFKYKIFVSPFTINDNVYDVRDSYLLDLKK